MVDRDYMRRDPDARVPGRFWVTNPVTKALIIVMVAIHVVLAFVSRAAPETWLTIQFYLRLNPEYALRHFYIWQLVTAGLLHARGILHLGFNCLFLWWFGKPVEARLGSRRYLLFCLVATVMASLAYLAEAVVIDNVIPMLGASGMVMGLIVLVALWYPNQEVMFFFVLRMPMWLLAVILVLMDVIYMLQAPGGIANTAHLGGALYGWIFYRFGGIERVFSAVDQVADKQRRKRAEKRAERDAELRKEIDRILDKVNREGMTGLTEEERRFLKQASNKLRR